MYAKYQGSILSKNFIKKLKKIYFLLLCFYSNIFSNDLLEQFCKLHLPQQSINFYFADNSKIELNKDCSYILYTMYWQNIINKGFIQLFSQIQKELGLSIEQIYELYSSKSILKAFNIEQEKKLLKIYSDPETILEHEIDGCFLSFLQNNFDQYISINNVEFMLNPNIDSIVEVLYDSKEDKYIVILNSYIYNLTGFYKINFTDKQRPLYFYKPHKNGLTLNINYKDLINSGFVIAASTIHHQLNLLSFILSNYKFYGNKASTETIILLARLISFQIDLEIILQTSNPLETALFYKNFDIFTANQKHWLKLIKNIESLYDEKSLKKFKKLSELFNQKKNNND